MKCGYAAAGLIGRLSRRATLLLIGLLNLVSRDNFIIIPNASTF
jgi:hypothetical protein